MASSDIDQLMARRRAQLGWSQGQVAAAAGTNQATVSRLERGGRDVRLSTLIEVARALGLELRLIPREVIPAVDDLIGAVRRGNESGEGNKPLYSLDDDDAAAD